MSGLGKIFEGNFRTRRDEQQDTLPQIQLQKPSKSWFSRAQLSATKVSFFSRVNPRKGRSAYLDLALIFLLFRFSLLILFFLHLALIALNHLSCRSESSNKSLIHFYKRGDLEQ